MEKRACGAIQGKLTPKWEGPSIIFKEVCQGMFTKYMVLPFLPQFLLSLHYGSMGV